MQKKDHFSMKREIFGYRGKRLDRFLERYEERMTDIEVPELIIYLIFYK